MKDTARKKDARQESSAQLVFAAMLDARATLHDAIVSAGMSVLGAIPSASCVATRACPSS